MQFKGYACITAAATLWGLLGPFSRLAFQEGLKPIEVAFWRAMLAWGFFGVHAVMKNEYHVRKRDMPALAVFGLTGVTLFFGSYQLAVSSGGIALAAVLLYTAPAWVVVMSRLFFRESVTWGKLAALLLTLIGVCGVSFGANARQEAAGSFEINAAALAFGIAAGFFYSLYYIFGKHFSGRYSSPNLFVYILPIGALALLPWVSFSAKTPTAWLALIGLAFISTYGAYYFYYTGLKYLEATQAAVTATLEPVVAALVAFLFWGECFTALGYTGSLMILSGVLLMIWDGSRQQR